MCGEGTKKVTLIVDFFGSFLFFAEAIENEMMSASEIVTELCCNPIPR
jgi:hypothetical protein